MAAKADEPTAVYEVRLQGTVGAYLRRQFPTAAVVTTRTETVMYRPVTRPAELHALVAELLSLGLVLTEARQVMGLEGPVSAFEQERPSR